MSEPPRIYLDTSVIDFLYAEDVPELQDVTRAFFDDFVKAGKYDAWISGSY